MATINSLDYFLRVLDDNPWWFEAVRAHILRQPFNDARWIAGDFGLEFVRVLTIEDLSLMAGNKVPIDVRRSFRNADLVIEGADETGMSYIGLKFRTRQTPETPTGPSETPSSSPASPGDRHNQSSPA